MSAVFSASLDTAHILRGSTLKRVRIPETVREAMSQWLDAKEYEQASLCVDCIRESRKVLFRMQINVPGLLGELPANFEDRLGRLCELAGFPLYSGESFVELLEELHFTLANIAVDRPIQVASQRIQEGFDIPEKLYLEMKGWRTLVQSDRSILLDRRKNYIEETYEALYSYGAQLFLLTLCRTGKVVLLPVGSSCQTCEDAQHWLCGDSVKSEGALWLPRMFVRGRS